MKKQKSTLPSSLFPICLFSTSNTFSFLLTSKVRSSPAQDQPPTSSLLLELQSQQHLRCPCLPRGLTSSFSFPFIFNISFFAPHSLPITQAFFWLKQQALFYLATVCAPSSLPSHSTSHLAVASAHTTLPKLLSP